MPMNTSRAEVVAWLTRLAKREGAKELDISPTDADLLALHKELLGLFDTPPATRPLIDVGLPMLSMLAATWPGETPRARLCALVEATIMAVEPLPDRIRLTHLLPRNRRAPTASMAEVGQRHDYAEKAATSGYAPDKQALTADRRRRLLPKFIAAMVEVQGKPELAQPDREIMVDDGSPEDLKKILSFLPTPPASRDLVRDERASSSRIEPEWLDGNPLPRWVGHIWAWWWSKYGEDANKFRYVEESSTPVTTVGDYTAEDPVRRFMLTALGPVVRDRPHHDICGRRISHDLVRHVEETTQLWRPDHTPFLDDTRRHPWPGMLVTHSIAVTSDGWILLSQRHENHSYFPGCVSATFEEQVDTTGDVKSAPDLTIGDTVRRGLSEEYAQAAIDIQCHLIGRECVALDPSTGLFVLNSAALCTMHLPIPLEQVWSRIVFAPDLQEHRGWAAFRPTSSNLATLLTAKCWSDIRSRLGSDFRVRDESGHETFIDTPDDPYWRKKRMWHPTSKERLAWWAFAHETPLI